MTFNVLFAQDNSKSVETAIICEMKDEWLRNRKLRIPEQFPTPINIAEVENGFKVDPSIFDNYPTGHELSYTYFVTVNDKGKVTDIDFLVLANGFIEEILKKSIMKIKFKPALINK